MKKLLAGAVVIIVSIAAPAMADQSNYSKAAEQACHAKKGSYQSCDNVHYHCYTGNSAPAC